MTEDPRQLLAVLFAQQGERLRRVAPRSDEGWRELYARCAALGATGLLHATLRRTRCADLAPLDVRTALRLAHGTHAAQNLALCAEAERVLAGFRAAGVLAAPMKGVALFRERVVEDLGVRPTSDFDVVTRAADRERVLRVLRELGYETRFEELSWKHLPPMRRGDLSIEVHEIAYWSSSTRAVFGVEHLAASDRPTRLGRLAALQLHHLVHGSPPDAALAIRTLGDVDAFLQLARRDDAIRRSLIIAAEAAGMAKELAAADLLLAEARHEDPISTRETASHEEASRGTSSGTESLLALLSAQSDSRHDVLGHALRTIPLQPWRVTGAMLSIVFFPPREVVAVRVGAAVDSPTVTIARIRRPFEVAARVLRSLATRSRAGSRAR